MRAMLAALLVLAIQSPVPAQRGTYLVNPEFRAEFGPRGLTAITALGHTIPIASDEFAITIDGTSFDSRTLPAPSVTTSLASVTFSWSASRYTVLTTYQIGATWISKQVSVAAAPGSTYRVNDVRVFDARLGEPVRDVYVPKSVRPALGTGDYGGALRLGGQRGLLAVVQNPFLEFTRDGDAFAIRYKPDMEWRAEHGPFVSDRGLLSPYRLTGRVVPDRMIPEWRLEGPSANGMDEGEIAAFTNLVRSFLLYRPDKPLNLMVGWCVNDYQIDVALPEGRTEYKRIIDRAAELGADHLLFAPSNSALSRREESKDDWSWEHTLWLGLGQKIRKGEWDPRRDPVPDSVREMLDYAKQRNVKLVAYVYPVVPFSQNPEWLVSRPDRPNRTYASLGVRSLQDWLIAELVAFQRKTGVGGFAFDHTFLTYDGTSRYAQWAGWRRVMEEVRKELPDIAIDGRQAYHLYGPWSWLAGSYPHPTFNDEQPESFVPFPDLHFDRVSADRQRYTAYRYRVYDFAPNEIVPGFANHQTSRGDDTGEMPELQTADRGRVLLPLRARDWDYLGWRYSLLSSIATAGWNNVLNMIPARDPEEFKAFSEEDRRWFRRWIDWTAENKELLRHTRSILGAPAIGKIDGTSAIVGNDGFVFLFNPNARRLEAELWLDERIGMASAGGRLLKELYPREGRLFAPAPGTARVTIPMDGGSAAVYRLIPATPARDPLLFNVSGRATFTGSTLALSGVEGEPGTTVEAYVAMPRPQQLIKEVTVNGQRISDYAYNGVSLSIPLRFAGARFSQYQPIVEYNASSTGGHVAGSFRIPQRIFDQLAARRKAWPIPWTAEDFRTTWLVPERLLLFVQIAEPDAKWEARLTIDGRTVELKKAYSAVRAAPRTFVGFYADLTALSADRDYRFELELPTLKAGQLQGVYFENVEPEYTTTLVR